MGAFLVIYMLKRSKRRIELTILLFGYIDCNALPTLTNGTVTLVDASITTYGALAEVNCTRGYDYNKRIIKCTAAGEWEAAYCEPHGLINTLYLTLIHLVSVSVSFSSNAIPLTISQNNEVFKILFIKKKYGHDGLGLIFINSFFFLEKEKQITQANYQVSNAALR